MISHNYNNEQLTLAISSFLVLAMQSILRGLTLMTVVVAVICIPKGPVVMHFDFMIFLAHAFLR